MWATLLLMAVAVSLEPIRVGLTVLMLNRPRPPQQLAAFLCGGFLMGLTVGVLALLLLDAAPVDTEHLTVGKVQVAIGLLALTAAALLATNVRMPWKRACNESELGAEHGPTTGGVTGSAQLLTAPTRVGRWTRLRTALQGGGSLWVAGISGLGIALPSVDYLAALAMIHASGLDLGAQLGTMLAFNVLAFALVEIPLLSYLFAPNATRVAMTRLDGWIRSRSRREVAGLLAAAGLIMIAIGWSGAA